jgi:hypothetical protein
MEFYFLNWVQLSCDFGKVFLMVPPKEKFVIHLGYWSPSIWVFDGIKLIHKKVGHMGTYHVDIIHNVGSVKWNVDGLN